MGERLHLHLQPLPKASLCSWAVTVTQKQGKGQGLAPAKALAFRYAGSMNKFALLPVLLKEVLSARSLDREPEADLVMDNPDQVAAYDEAGSISGLMASAYLFHTARISQVIGRCREVVDLGCGPAIQLCQVAQLHPLIAFHGIDLSPTMLENARANAQRLGLANMRFSLGDITRLSLEDASVDGVISTMALHHLPSLDDLRNCFRGVSRILKPGGALYLVDFTRFKRLSTLTYFAHLHADEQPELFRLDYERSLKAAFSPADFKRLGQEELPGHVRAYSTLPVPMLTVIKSDDEPLGTAPREQIGRLTQDLSPRFRGDLNDIRMFFRLGGLADDPFKGL